MGRRRHDGIVAHGHGVAAAVHAAPRLHRRTRGQTAFEDFVPADHLAAVCFEVTADLTDEPGLQFVFVVQAFSGYAALAFRALFPPNLGGLVPADVDVFRWKQLHDLVQNRFQERQRGVLAGAVNVFEHPPIVRHLQCISCTS